MSEEIYYYLRKSCCSGKVYGRFTFEELREQFGYENDPEVCDINALERRLVEDYKGFDVPYYIERVCRK